MGQFFDLKTGVAEAHFRVVLARHWIHSVHSQICAMCTYNLSLLFLQLEIGLKVLVNAALMSADLFLAFPPFQ